jgi:short-subunit dehydrogenase
MIPPPQTALVTGASSGIGAATARLLAGQGVALGLVARRADRLATVADACRDAGATVHCWPADLADLELARQVARRAWETLGGVDVLVNNAARPMRRPVQALTLADVERTMRLNFLSPAAITLELLPDMLERRRGVVVNVSSLGGRLGIMTEAAYSASKFALCGWSEAIAADLAGTGVTIRLVLPGAIATEIWDQPDNDPPLYTGPLEPPELVAEGILAAVGSEHFEHYLPDMRPVVEMKTVDIDGFLAGMRALAPPPEPSASPATPADTRADEGPAGSHQPTSGPSPEPSRPT